MSERWCKLYPHAMTDPAWIAVAAEAQSSRALVGATFVELLCYACEHAPDSGSIAGFDVRIWAAWAERPPDEIGRILDALRSFGRLAGDQIANWTKRQIIKPTAEASPRASAAGSTSTPRTRKHRQTAKERERQGELLLPIAGGGAGTSGTPGTGVPNPEEERRGESEKTSSFADALKGENDNNEVSERGCAAPSAADAAVHTAKRLNMVRGVRDWLGWSPHAEADPETAMMLGRAEAAAAELELWNTRTPADKLWFERVRARARAQPLDSATREMLRNARRPGGQDPGFQQIMARAGWVHRQAEAA